jgi:hypothetical protein
VAPMLSWDDDAQRRAVADYEAEIDRTFAIG